MSLTLNLHDIITVRLEYEDALLNKAFNILHYRLFEVSGGPGGLWAGESMFTAGPLIAEEMMNHFSADWSNTAAQDITMSGVTVQDIWPLPKSRQYTFTPPAPIAGSIVSDPLPMQDAVTILKRGEEASRKSLGRAYIPGVPETGQDGGVLTDPQRALYDTLAVKFELVVPVLVGGWTLNFYPVLFNPDELPAPEIRHIMDCDVSDNVIKTQRRRRPGKGI